MPALVTEGTTFKCSQHTQYIVFDVTTNTWRHKTSRLTGERCVPVRIYVTTTRLVATSEAESMAREVRV